MQEKVVSLGASYGQVKGENLTGIFMGRRRSSAVIQRQATLALARENFYRNRPASTLTTVRPRKTDSAVYASLLLKDSAGSTLFKVPVSDAAVTFFGGLAALGLRSPAGITDPVSPKPRNFTPAMVKAMVGTTTPTASVSPWGTRVIKYSTATAGTAQAHYQAAISGTVANMTYDLVDQRATTIFNAIRSTLGSLDYARFYLTPEVFNNSKN